jgi:hypothetical protein
MRIESSFGTTTRLKRRIRGFMTSFITAGLSVLALSLLSADRLTLLGASSRAWRTVSLHGAASPQIPSDRRTTKPRNHVVYPYTFMEEENGQRTSRDMCKNTTDKFTHLQSLLRGLGCVGPGRRSLFLLGLCEESLQGWVTGWTVAELKTRHGKIKVNSPLPSESFPRGWKKRGGNRMPRVAKTSARFALQCRKPPTGPSRDPCN